jgi:NTP pyrophosphatase (non-canonical NTP hydrolase)
MEVHEYQSLLDNYAMYPEELGPFYLILNTQESVGELSKKLKEFMAKDIIEIDNRDKTNLSITIGDIIANLTLMATSLDLDLQDILSINIRKLSLLKSKKLQKQTKAENY